MSHTDEILSDRKWFGIATDDNLDELQEAIFKFIECLPESVTTSMPASDLTQGQSNCYFYAGQLLLMKMEALARNVETEYASEVQESMNIDQQIEENHL